MERRRQHDPPLHRLLDALRRGLDGWIGSRPPDRLLAAELARWEQRGPGGAVALIALHEVGPVSPAGAGDDRTPPPAERPFDRPLLARLRRSMRRSDRVLDLGDGRVALILPGVEGPVSAAAVFGRVDAALVATTSHRAGVALAAGFRLVPARTPADPEQILRDAEAALQVARTDGRARFEVVGWAAAPRPAPVSPGSTLDAAVSLQADAVPPTG